MTLGRIITRYLALFVVMLPFAARAAPDGERRIALVIGVGSYQNASHLTNPVNDARAIGESLRRLKFEVMELYDPKFGELNASIRAFGIRAADADVAIVYYAGHGVQVAWRLKRTRSPKTEGSTAPSRRHSAIQERAPRAPGAGAAVASIALIADSSRGTGCFLS
jgi:hypothetical protein